MIELNKKEKICVVLFGLHVFLFFVFFLSIVHPIVISDTDDWLYSYDARNAIPIWKLWNPTRVFPEIFMPFVTRICAYGIYPFFKMVSIFKCLTVAYAVTVSLAQVLMLYQLGKMFKRIKIGVLETLFYLSVYILCGFWIFRSSADSPNTYFLHTLDACTYFYYVISNLLACGLVCYMMFRENEEGIFLEGFRNNILILAIYLCIFSNLFSSITFMVYVGTSLLVDIKKEKWKVLVKNKLWKIITLCLWILALFMEVNGGRADYNAYFGSFGDCLLETIRLFWGQMKTMNRAYCISALFIVILGLVIALRTDDKKHIGFYIFGLINAFLIAIYEILLCAKVEPAYIQRFDVFYGIFFWITLIEILSLYRISQSFSAIRLIYILIIIIIAFNCETTGKTYRDSMVRQDLEPEASYQICDDIIEQLQQGDRSGTSEMNIFVPQFNEFDNWPYGTYAGQRFAEFAYAYGLTSNRIRVLETIASPDKNYLLNGGLSN